VILRAIFWIAVVALLMPHEPDLGLGRPVSIDAPSASSVLDWAKTQVAPRLAHPGDVCRYDPGACNTGTTVLDGLRAATMRSLADVKADLDRNASIHIRTRRGGG